MNEISLRDYFAGEAMILAQRLQFKRFDSSLEVPENPCEEVAEMSYEMADAMMKEREKNDEPKGTD